MATSRGFIDELAAGLHRLRWDLGEAKRKAAETARLKAPAFNVFDVLGIGDRESVHSNFLVELLDPAAKHGQRTSFLSSFLAICGNKSGIETPTFLDLESWADEVFVRREASIFQGRFDVLVHAPKHLYLIIENKISAKEGETQMQRYRDWLVQRPERYKLLIFLTPDGHPAKAIRDQEYIRLSYALDICRWLTECLDRLEPQQLRSIIEQYLDLIDRWRITLDV